jgi:transcriptional regulatory protein LevR
MELDGRLGILLEGKVISAEVAALVRRVISRLRDRWGIILTEQNGGCMITHLAMALARIERGEEIAAPERDLLDEFRNTDSFLQAVEIVKDLTAFTPLELPAAEGDYLVINVCLLLDGGDEG